MSILGDLGGGLLALLYDARYLLLALGAAGLVVVLLLARRYRWGSVARRHPVASGVATLAALVVVAPVAWYLLSPIWIRTELIEPPVAAAELPPATASPSSAVPLPHASAPAATTPPATTPTLAASR